MRIVFISNYFNHHQSSFSNEMYKLTKGDYFFVETVPFEKERREMGWKEDKKPSYVIQSYKTKADFEYCKKLAYNADAVIIGAADDKLIKERLKRGKLVLRYSERKYKNKKNMLELPFRAVKYYFSNDRYRNLYMLCASAYAAADFAKTGSLIGRTYKWGYFPEIRKYDNINCIIDKKLNNHIIWGARFIDLKHPESAVNLARHLRDEGYQFTMDLIGNGDMYEDIQLMIDKYGLNGYVKLKGTMTSHEVRNEMEKAQIFIFTSDFNEGWGAVLNEAMNSGCCAVASHAVGAAPFLIQDGKNGMIYQNGDDEDLYIKVKYLIDNPQIAKRIAKNAYLTIINEWNAEQAASRLMVLIEKMLEGIRNPDIFDSGICSRSEVIKNNWYTDNRRKLCR